MDKQTLRQQYKKIRAHIENRSELNHTIFQKVIELQEYKQADLILAYVSLNDEVDTTAIIRHSFKMGKKVAVPKCEGNTITFYDIESLDDLAVGKYGILEPTTERMRCDFSGSICLVPGVAFDAQNNRIGYGAGFYDRFLQHYQGMKIGLAYRECICETIDCDRYDIKMDQIICA